jgi:hypothetical protein
MYVLSISDTMRDAMLSSSNRASCMMYLKTLESSPVIPLRSLKGTYLELETAFGHGPVSWRNPCPTGPGPT